MSRRPDGPPPVVTGFPDEAAEAAAVCRWLRRAHRPGRNWSQLAVLARTNARLAPLAAALAQGGVPYRLAGSPRPGDLQLALRQLQALAPELPFRPALADLHQSVGAPAADTLRRLGDELAEDDPDPTVGSFVGWFAATVGDPSELDLPDGADDDAVQVATFHRAKGLEWDAVALVGLEQGLVPPASASSAGWAEERRLLYVAATRAADELWCSWAANHRRGDRQVPGAASPLLDLLAAATTSPPAPGPDAVADHLAELRRRLDATHPA